MDSATWQNTKPFMPKFTCGKVIKVYDGDTCTVAACISNLDRTIYRFNIRILGIDCPEIKSSDPIEKAQAVQARDQLHELIFNKTVKVNIVGNDKYGGRILGEIWTEDGISISKYMIDNKLAVAYDGGTKKAFSSR